MLRPYKGLLELKVRPRLLQEQLREDPLMVWFNSICVHVVFSMVFQFLNRD